MENLKKKSIDGVIWTLLEKVGIQFIKIILGVVLARLLTPADYGLIGMITVFFAIAMVFIDSGFGLAYIQKQDTNEVDASTIFYFNLIVSSLFFGVLWLTAPLIATFYEQEQLVELIRVMSIVLIINSFGLIQVTKLKKDVNFKKKTIVVLASAVLATSSGIIAALSDYGVWSLVIQEIVRSIVKSVGFWIFYKWRPLLVFNLNSLMSMLSFSSWALFSGILTSVFNNIYVLVIGKFFPAAQLGFYTKASQFRGILTKIPSNAVGAVAFPVFSKLQNNTKELKSALRKFNQHTMFLVLPLAAVFIVIAEPFFLLLLTKKWLLMVPYFQLLLIAGVLYPIHMINVQVLGAQGKMKLSFKISMIKNVLRVLNIIIMYRFGVIYIIYGEIVTSYLALIINTYYTKRFINYGLLEQLKDLSTMMLTSILLVLLGTILVNELSNDYVKIVVGGLFVGVFYLISIYLFNKKVLIDNLEILKSKIAKNK